MSTSMPHTGSIAMAMLDLLVRRYSPGVYRRSRDRHAATAYIADGPTRPDAVRAAARVERPGSLAELGETIEAPGQMTYGSQAAAASQVFEQQRDLALRDRATQQLELVDAALARLEAGTFGTCIRCGKPIAAGTARGAAVGRPLHRLPAHRRRERR